MIAINRNAIRIVEQAWWAAQLVELGQEREAIVTREYLHSIVASIGDKQETSMMVEHQACWIVELAISIAMCLGADGDLDSSISIKRIVSHRGGAEAATTRRRTKERTAPPTSCISICFTSTRVVCLLVR